MIPKLINQYARKPVHAYRCQHQKDVDRFSPSIEDYAENQKNVVPADLRQDIIQQEDCRQEDRYEGY